MLNLNPARMAQMTTCPGTPSYMPPEALVTKPIYTTKVDTFSYGNLITHVFSGIWPIPTAAFRVDPSNPNVMIPATEVERREEYLQDIGDTHPLIALTRQCLSNNPLIRPEALEILARISEVMPQFPPSFQNKVGVLQQIETDRNEKRSLTSRIEEQQQQIAEYQMQIEEKYRQIAQLEMSHSLEREGTRTRVNELSSEIEILKMTIKTKEELVSSKQQQVQAARDIATTSQQELSTTHTQLKVKDELLAAKDQQLSAKDQQLSAKDQQLSAKDQQLAAKGQQVQAKQQEFTAKEQELSSLAQELAAKDQELNAQRSEISALRELIANKEAALETKESTTMNIRSQASQLLQWSQQLPPQCLQQPLHHAQHPLQQPQPERSKQAKAAQELKQLKQALPDQSVNVDSQRACLQAFKKENNKMKVAKRSSLPPRGEAYTGESKAHLQPLPPHRQHSYEPVMNGSPSNQRKYLGSRTKSASVAHGEHIYNHLDTRSYQQRQPHEYSALPHEHQCLSEGSCVQLVTFSEACGAGPRYGVIRWLGEISGVRGTIAGVEMEEPMEGCTDGTFQMTGQKLFDCPDGSGLFYPFAHLKPDERFTDPGTTPGAAAVANPLKHVPYEEFSDQNIGTKQISKYLGDERGIQGHQNSCYLDATVFGLFGLSDVFDSMFLESSMNPTSSNTQQEVSSILWKRIINPLRKNGVVRFESVMQLRNKLEELGKMKGIAQDEKDPEEFLNMLFKHTLQVEPFIHIRRPFGTEQEYFVQLFLEYDETMKLPSVGDLLTKMFKEQKISFTELPSKLLIQVPRFGKQFKTYQKIIPDLSLDVIDLTDSPTSCYICGNSAWWKCEICVPDFSGKTPEGIPFCSDCVKKVHEHPERSNHKYEMSMEQYVKLELLSVICIETSHYVCFTRAEDQWILFDSMANRVYDMYNIPKVVECTQQLNEWVYSGNHQRLLDTPPRELPEFVRRFTQDIYLCVYIQPDAGMYG